MLYLSDGSDRLQRLKVQGIFRKQKSSTARASRGEARDNPENCGSGPRKATSSRHVFCSACAPAPGLSLWRWQAGQHLPLSRQLVVGIVAAADAEAEELAGGALDLLPLGLRGALQELVAVLQVPVVAPVLMDAPNAQEVVARETLHEGFKLI